MSKTGHINVNENSNPSGVASQTYATLRTTTKAPSAPIVLINPQDSPYRTYRAAHDAGKLHPNQDRVYGAYYNISSAYGSEPINLYTTRTCAGTF
jgi:hypothetical protein